MQGEPGCSEDTGRPLDHSAVGAGPSGYNR